MGLDMYLEGEEHFMEKKKSNEGFNIKGLIFDLGYWRKHPNLHGFIVNTFAGGKDECQRIYLSGDDLRQTLEASEADLLPETQGFFFGSSQPEDKADTKEILEAAIKWLESSPDNVWRQVSYRASW